MEPQKTEIMTYMFLDMFAVSYIYIAVFFWET